MSTKLNNAIARLSAAKKVDRKAIELEIAGIIAEMELEKAQLEAKAARQAKQGGGGWPKVGTAWPTKNGGNFNLSMTGEEFEEFVERARDNFQSFDRPGEKNLNGPLFFLASKHITTKKGKEMDILELKVKLYVAGSEKVNDEVMPD